MGSQARASLPRPCAPQVFAHMVPDPANKPPVHNINMDSQGRFAFVEFQNDEMATKALEMDHIVSLSKMEGCLWAWLGAAVRTGAVGASHPPGGGYRAGAMCVACV